MRVSAIDRPPRRSPRTCCTSSVLPRWSPPSRTDSRFRRASAKPAPRRSERPEPPGRCAFETSKYNLLISAHHAIRRAITCHGRWKHALQPARECRQRSARMREDEADIRIFRKRPFTSMLLNAREVSKSYSTQDSGIFGTSSAQQVGAVGCTNTTAFRRFSSSKVGRERRIAQPFVAIAGDQRNAVGLQVSSAYSISFRLASWSGKGSAARCPKRPG